MGQSKTTQLNRNTQTPRTPEPTVRHIVEQLATAREHWLKSSSSREKHKRKRFRAHPVAVVVLVVAVDEDLLLLPLLPAAAAAATCASLASLSLFAAPLPGADPIKGHGCTRVHPIIFAKTSKFGVACQILANSFRLGFRCSAWREGKRRGGSTWWVLLAGEDTN